MSEINLNPLLRVDKLVHEDPEIAVFVVEDFLENPERLLDYAREKAYFGNVGDDRTAYPGIRDRLPKPYERAMAEVVSLVYGIQKPEIRRCMLSLATLPPEELADGQKIPHVDAFADDRFAAVHFLCGKPHGGTAIYRYLPENLVRLRENRRGVVRKMIRNVARYPQEHQGYLKGDTRFYKQEVVVEAQFNRLVLYPSNLLHCAMLTSPKSLTSDVETGRLTVASFFRLVRHTPEYNGQPNP